MNLRDLRLRRGSAPRWRDEGARGVPESVAVRETTGERLFDRRQELVAGSILRDESRRTRFERALPDLGVAGGCKKDDAAVRRRGFYLIRASLGEVLVTAAKEGYNTRESRFDVTDSTVLNFGLTPLLP